MKARLAIAGLVVFAIIGIRYAYMRGYPPFTSQFVKTCDNAIRERLAVPSSYQRIDVEESRRTMTFDEFFTDPLRAVSEASRKAMIEVARVLPVQYVALIDYQAEQAVGAIIRERATCTFNSLDGTDAPTKPDYVMIDGKYKWENNPAFVALLRRLREQQR